MTRVLLVLSPRLCREAVAGSIRRARPGLDVRVASPGEAELDLAGFRPHLLVHNDSLPVPERALEAAPTRVEVTYSDGMEAWVRAGGTVSRVRDMSTEDSLRTVAVAATLGGPD